MTPRTPRSAKSKGALGSGRSRFERDALGIREIPATAYWGLQTLRALEAVPIACTQTSSRPALVRALAQIKRASVLADAGPCLMDEAKKTAIVQACREIEQGRLLDQFVVDVLQCDAAAAANANANEVIANRALEILGHERGTYSVIHPHHDLDTGLSAKDVYSTAIKLAAIEGTHELLSVMADLRQELATPALEAHECRIHEALGPLDSIGAGGLVLLSDALTHAATGLSTCVPSIEPALAEVTDHVAFDVMGNDLTIRLAAEAGRSTRVEPVIAQALFRSLSRLTSACAALAEHTLSPALETLPLLTRN